MSVKAYAELVEKSDKTIYKQITKGTVRAVKVEKGFRVCVDPNMLKRMHRLEDALEEAKSALKLLEEEVRSEKSTTTAAASAAPQKKPVAKPVKTVTKRPAKPTAVQSVSKPAVKKRTAASSPKKRR
jgi:hypothetical protein